MNVLSVGTDVTVFEKGSAAQMRQEKYAKHFDSFTLLAPRMRFTIPFFVARALSKQSIDVVTVQDPFETGLLTLIGMIGRNIPLHVQIHTDFLDPEYARLSVVNWVRVRIVPFVLKRATRIRVVSERVKTSIQKEYGMSVPIAVLPIYVDVARYKHAQVDDSLLQRFSRFEKKLLVVSRLEKEKNIELAIRAFAHAYSKSECLIIVGEGNERGRLEFLARELDLEGFIFFEGAHDPAPYYKIADVLLVPSHYEGYGLVIVEALAAGIPVLSTDVGIAREAGAIVASPADFPDALFQWLSEGASEGVLRSYPYESEEAYVRAWVEDVEACKRA